MYLDSDSTEFDALRQGDILRDIELVGAFNINAIRRTLDVRNEIVAWSVESALKRSIVMVLSHSCEIALENNIKVTSIILAPIRDVHRATSPDKLQEVIESNIIDPENPAPSYLKYFYLEPHEKIEYADGGIVDFAKLFSVHKSSYQRLVDSKILQLKPDFANQMAYKLGLYFFRRSQ